MGPGKYTHGTPVPTQVGTPWVARTVRPAQSHTECATNTQDRYTANMVLKYSGEQSAAVSPWLRELAEKVVWFEQRRR